MKNCLTCNSENVERAKNDCGFFKPTNGRPLRMYQYRCQDCGYIATYAKSSDQESSS